MLNTRALLITREWHFYYSLKKRKLKLLPSQVLFPFLFPPSSQHIDIIHLNTRKSLITQFVSSNFSIIKCHCYNVREPYIEHVHEALIFLCLTETLTWWAMAFLCKILFGFGLCHIVSVRSQQVCHDISPIGKAWVWVLVLFCYFKSMARITVKVLKTPQPSKYSIKTVFKIDT